MCIPAYVLWTERYPGCPFQGPTTLGDYWGFSILTLAHSALSFPFLHPLVTLTAHDSLRTWSNSLPVRKHSQRGCEGRLDNSVFHFRGHFPELMATQLDPLNSPLVISCHLRGNLHTSAVTFCKHQTGELMCKQRPFPCRFVCISGTSLPVLVVSFTLCISFLCLSLFCVLGYFSGLLVKQQREHCLHFKFLMFMIPAFCHLRQSTAAL